MVSWCFLLSGACRLRGRKPPHFLTIFGTLPTLTDAQVYTRDELAKLYYRRWSVELYYLRDIKTTMGMEKLRCQTPAMARKELRMYIIAYNLIRGLIQQSAERWNQSPDRLSFKASVDTLRQFTSALNATKHRPREQERIIDEMLRIIASEVVPSRLDRSEPRALKERPKPYPRLTSHRSVYTVPKSRRNRGKPKSKSANKAA